MKTRLQLRSLCMLLTVALLLPCVLIPGILPITAAEITPTPNSYVTDGLVSLYMGDQNTRAGHDTSSTVWEDLISGYDVTVTADENNYFTETGYHLHTSQHAFPQEITDLVNGESFTVEILLKDWYQISKYYSTFLASENDYFSLFYRKAKSYIELKAANCGSSSRATAPITLDTVDSGQYYSDLLLTVTYDATGESKIYYNGVLSGEKAAQGLMGADTMFFGNIHTNKYHEATYESIRFYDRELTEAEVKHNAAVDGYGDIADLYVADGLVALYSGENHEDSAWTDLSGNGNHMTLSDTTASTFDRAGLHMKNAANFFPAGVLEAINESKSYTIEMNLDAFTSTGTKYNTILNGFSDASSSTEILALFRRIETGVLEYKCSSAAAADGGRATVANAIDFMPHSTIAVTFASGGVAELYVNGTLYAETTVKEDPSFAVLQLGNARANRCFITTYRGVRVYDRALSAEELLANANADGTSHLSLITTPDHISVAQPRTNIIGDVAMTRPIGSADELAAMMAATELPAAAIYSINASLEILDENGTAFSTLPEVLEATEYSVIPILVPADSATLAAIADYAKTQVFRDLTILTDDTALLNEARSVVSVARGALDMTETYANATALTKEQCVTIRRTVRANGGSIVVLPAHLCDQDTVQYLFDLQINVWARAADTMSETDCYQALLSGAVGVISDDTAALLDVACNDIPANTQTRVPLEIAHRGLMSSAPENTIEGSIAAYEKGATVIEMDVYLTTDGKLAVMHDSTTERTCDQNLTVEKSSWEQLSQLYVNKGFEDDPVYSQCRIPLLDDYFETFKDTDCRLFIEIKSSKVAIIEPIKALIEQYDCYDRCTIITSRDAILTALREQYPEMPACRLAKSGDGAHILESDADASIVNTMEIIGPFNAAHSPYKKNYAENAPRALMIRGLSIYPWTVNDETTAAQDYEDLIGWGYSSVTTNFAGMMADYVQDHKVTGLSDSYVGKTMTAGLLCSHSDKTTSSAENVSVQILSGSEHVEVDGTSITVKSTGTVTLVVGGTYTVGSTTFSLLSQPVTLEVGTQSAATWVGYQESAEELNESKRRYDRDLRLLASIGDLTGVESIAFAITVNGGAQRTVYLEYAYEQITTDFGNNTLMAPENGLFLALTIHNCPTETNFTAKVITVYEDGSVAEDLTYGFAISKADSPAIITPGEYETDKDVIDFGDLIPAL